MFPIAASAAQRALELDESLAEAHASLGFVKMSWEWDWDGVLSELQRTIELNPNHETAHRWLSAFLAGIGRVDEAMPIAERALLLDPLSVLPHMNLGIIHFLSGNYVAAEAEFRHVLEMQPGFLRADTFLGATLSWQGRDDEAIRVLEARYDLCVGAWYLLCDGGSDGRRARAPRSDQSLELPAAVPRDRAQGAGRTRRRFSCTRAGSEGALGLDVLADYAAMVVGPARRSAIPGPAREDAAAGARRLVSVALGASSVTRRDTVATGSYASWRFHPLYDVAPDGKHLLVLELSEKDVPATVILNWASAFAARLAP
jgi:tetratricopeptide (TPR) repeat protein